LGSAFEWETQLIVSSRQKYISKEEFNYLEIQINDLQRKISNFMDRFE